MDVYVRKTVAPAVDATGKLSSLEPVGFNFTFTLEVGVTSPEAAAVANDVVLLDTLPAGLELKGVSESPDQNGATPTARSALP